MAIILVVLQLISFCPSQEYIQDRFIPWQVLAEYFPRLLNGKGGDGEIKGSEHKAGPASTSMATGTYGDKKYALTLHYAIENNLSPNTKIAHSSRKNTSTAKTYQQLRDESFSTIRVGKYNAIASYNNWDSTAEITVFLENHVSVELIVKDAKHLNDAIIVFNTIDLDKINQLEP